MEISPEAFTSGEVVVMCRELSEVGFNYVVFNMPNDHEITPARAAATQLGQALGASLGGIILDLSGWGVMGLIYGGMHIATALIYLAGVNDREEYARMNTY